MVGTLNILNRKVKTEKEIELDNIKSDIRECEFLMSRNEIIFNMATDEKLIESKIYEREALLRHYDYLVRLVRDKQQQNSIVKSMEIDKQQPKRMAIDKQQQNSIVKMGE